MPLVRILRPAALLVALGLFAGACGDDDGGETGPTTTTAAPTSTTAATTTTEGDDPQVAPLTGLPVDDPAVLSRPAIMVKIDNSDTGSCQYQARPQAGVDRADLIFEMEVEGGITRFAVVLHSTPPDVAGPVRSARSSDIDIISAFDVPLVAYSGSNANVAAELQGIGNRFVNVGHGSAAGGLFFRDRSRCAPANLFVEPADLYDFASEQGDPPEPVFAHRALDASGRPLDESVAGIRFSRGNEVVYVWNEDTATWDRFQRGTPHLAADDEQISPANVVVLDTQYRPSSTPGSPAAVTVGEGDAVVYRDGGLVEGTWRRADATAPWELTTAEGSTIELAPGRTVVHLARPASYDTLDDQAVSSYIE